MVDKREGKFDVLMKHLKPLIVAVSANEDTPEMQRQCIDEGFDLYIQAPLTTANI